MKTTSLGVSVLFACPAAGDATSPENKIGSESANPRIIVTLLESGWLLALRRRACGSSKRRGHCDPPSFGRLYEHPLGYSTRSRILLRHRVAVGTVDDTRRDRHHLQISGDQGVRPGRIASSTPAFVSKLESSGSVTRKGIRVKVSGEIPRTVTFVY